MSTPEIARVRSRAHLVRTIGFAIVAMLGGVPASVSLAASFPCDKATTTLEQTICRDDGLSQLDDQLARYFSAARVAVKGGSQCLLSDQQRWLREVRNRCADISCLQHAYALRLAELDGLQPGATALKDIALSSAPVLVWILPPALDTIAAPPLRDAPVFSAQGILVNDLANGDGYLMRSADGSQHLVVLSMFIDESTSMLDALASQTMDTYLIRGQLAPIEDGQKNFAQSSCRYVYRLSR